MNKDAHARKRFKWSVEARLVSLLCMIGYSRCVGRGIDRDGIKSET